jgi:anti-anti-sigma factor
MATVAKLRDLLDEFRHRQQAVVLDLAEVSFIDSSGLRVLLEATAEAVRAGAVLAVESN